MCIRRSFIFAGAFALYVQLLIVGHCEAQIVFDNTVSVSSGTSFGPGCCLSGTEVSIDEPAAISQIEWLLDGQSSGVSAVEIQIAIHANDGLSGAPSTELWTQTFSNLAIAPDRELYSFAVPDVQVPQNFTVTSRVLSSVPIATGFPISDSADVGVAVQRWVLNSSGNWGTNSLSSLRAFRITAMPIPLPLLGDVNLDDVVDFLDVAPFVEVLFSAGFQVEADMDQNEVVSFGDVSLFIAAIAAGS